MPTSPAIAELPFVTAKRKELAQSRKARIAERSRLEVGEDFLKRHPRCRPIISAVVQQTAFANGESLGLRSRQSRSWRISRLLARASPALAAANAAPSTSSGFVSIRGRRRCVLARDDDAGRTNLRKVRSGQRGRRLRRGSPRGRDDCSRIVIGYLTGSRPHRIARASDAHLNPYPAAWK